MMKIGSNLTKYTLMAALALSAGLGSTYGMKENELCGPGSGNKWISYESIVSRMDSLNESDIKGIQQNLSCGKKLDLPSFLDSPQLKALFHEKAPFVQLFGKFVVKISIPSLESKNLEFLNPKAFPNLRLLSIQMAKLENLSGIEKLSKIESVFCNYCWYLEDISALTKCPNLKYVDVHGSLNITMKSIKEVAENDKIIIDLSPVVIGETAVALDMAINHPPGLQSLTLDSCECLKNQDPESFKSPTKHCEDLSPLQLLPISLDLKPFEKSSKSDEQKNAIDWENTNDDTPKDELDKPEEEENQPKEKNQESPGVTKI